MQEVLSYLIENVYTISWSVIAALVVTAIALVSIGSLESEIMRRQKAEEELKKKIDELNVAQKYLKKQEEYLHAVLSSMGEGLVVCDKDCRVQMINQFGASLLRHPPTEAVGKTLMELSDFYSEHAEKKDDVLPITIIQKILEEPDIITITPTDKLFCKNAHGMIFPMLLTAAPLEQKNGDKSAVLLFRDGSVEVGVDRAKSEFVSIASHQLRTPLSTIGWYTQMLLTGDGGKLTVAQTELLQEVEKSNERMVELVDALLNTSRIEMGTFVIQPEELDWKELIKDVIKDIKQPAEAKNLKLKVSMDKKIPTVPADPKLLRIIVQNLLTNAVKYTPDKGRVDVVLETQPDLILLSVKDTGYGIPKEEQSKIFSKMFRASNVKELSMEGNGLGLYIVKSIVEQGGGKIWFESSENQGTTFYIQFPLTGMKAREGTKQLN